MDFQLDRRIFLGAAGAGLVLGIAGCAPQKFADGADGELNMWVTVAPDGRVTIRLNATDIGQGAQTGIAQIVADEMDADWTSVRVEMAPVTPRYRVKGDDKGYYTGGSSSIRGQFAMFAQAGAAARAMLIEAAAEQWAVAPASCTASHGVVSHGPSGRALGYGALAAAAARRGVPKTVSLKQPQARFLVGTSVRRLDIPDKVNGAATYGIDIKLPGMLIGTIAQCPWFGGTLNSVAPEPALAIKGVVRVVTLDNAVAVVAKNFFAAKKGLETLAPRWTKPVDRLASDDEMYRILSANIGSADSHVATLDKKTEDETVAAVTRLLAASHRTIASDYRVQLLAHAPMEPMNATAYVADGRCELWAPMQAQDDMLDDLSKALALPRQAITLHSLRAGGGFGRRLKTDYGVLAALVAKQLDRPVKLIWTREEDFTHDFYRPASVARVRASLRDDWTIEALDYAGATTNDTAIGGFARNYRVGAVMARQKQTAFSFPIGAWRSVDQSITIFFLESFVDEIAHAAKLDPLDYRRRLLAEEPRQLRVLNAAAQMAGWGNAPDGHAQGIAFFSSASWGTAVAQVVELSVDATNHIVLHKVSCAIDPGLAVNPGQVAAQAEGGIILGLSAALGEIITMKDGRVEQTNFDSYTVPRLRSIPEIAVRVLESDGEAPGGVGEPPVPPIAPALANALFAATGKRIRILPLSKSGFSV